MVCVGVLLFADDNDNIVVCNGNFELNGGRQ